VVNAIAAAGRRISAALQELLAARLTDASEADAARAREVIALALTVGAPEARPAAYLVAGYYDDQICALVARLGVYEPAVLAQIRAEAFATRMIAILGAIERHTAALRARPVHRTEASFLDSYRRHVIDQHGKLEPPDFERRRRVPIRDIYVPTVITEDFYPEREVVPHPVSRFSPDPLYDLAVRLDRSVLLGDPGGGKSAAANVLMNHFARDPDDQVPFFVTLRDYAAQDPPERSVVGHIEYTLETFYQCPAPPGLVDLLLLTGRAVVIFDGLDELLDTSRRVDVTARVEHFLHGRGFESADDARAAALEFVEFCRGRIWVFSDAGTTASGERLYAFTHRTFQGRGRLRPGPDHLQPGRGRAYRVRLRVLPGARAADLGSHHQHRPDPSARARPPGIGSGDGCCPYDPRLPGIHGRARHCAVRSPCRGGVSLHDGINRRTAGEREDPVRGWSCIQRADRVADLG